MIRTLIVAARDRERLGEITAVAARYGLDRLLAPFGLGALAGGGDAGTGQSLPQRTRLALEELGPTFVKLGQILATRSDLLGPEWTEELERLHSSAPTLPFDALRPDVEAALGEAPEEAFAAFDTAPLAAASIAQVHRATLRDGRAVVLKIRRPGIRARMEADLRLIRHLAAMAESASAEARRFAPQALVEQLATAILEELDFTGEGRNADRLRADFAGDPRVVIPRIHWEWTSESLLVMDYVEGVQPRGAAALEAAGIDPAAIAGIGADLVLDMILIHGRFHGDPHPGNLLCLPGNRLALLDLGMIGHVSPRRREELLGFVQAISAGDPGGLADSLAIWSAQAAVPRERLLLGAEQLVARHADGKLVLAAMVADFFQLMRTERLAMPPDLLLIFKALVTVDGVLNAIAPAFDLSEAMRRSALRIVSARLSPAAWAPVLQALLLEMTRLGEDAPRLLRLLTKRLETQPAPTPARADVGAAVRSAGKWVAGAMVLSTVIAATVLSMA